jgi:hypothetical protein
MTISDLAEVQLPKKGGTQMGDNEKTETTEQSGEKSGGEQSGEQKSDEGGEKKGAA